MEPIQNLMDLVEATRTRRRKVIPPQPPEDNEPLVWEGDDG